MKSSGRIAPEAGWDRIDTAFVVACAAVALWLRAAGIFELGFHSDEAIFISVGGNESALEVWRNSLVGPHPPANYLLLHLMTAISWAPAWLKLAPLVGGTLCAPFAYLLGRALLDRWAGAALAFAIAFSPGLIELSRVVRNYAPGYALVLLALYFVARYAATRDRRWLVAFAVAELLAATWHYTFVTLFLGAAVALAVALLRWRAPLREWIQVAAVQLPLAAFYGFAYFVQIAPNRDALSATSQELYGVDYALAIEGDVLPSFLAPFREVLVYLSTPELGLPWLGLALAGAVVLAVRRRYFALALLLGPLPFAFALQAVGISPIGGTRHSAYLFVPLLGLASAIAFELGIWFRRWQGTARAVVPAVVLATIALVAVLASWSAIHRGIETERGFVVGVRNITALETPTRLDDVERLEQLLVEHVEEDDLILLSYNSMLVLRVLLAPGPMSYAPEEPVHFEYAGLDFYYAPSELPSLSAVRFREALDYIEQSEGLRPTGRVWVPHVGWELYAPSLTEIFRAVHRGESWDRMKIIHHKNEGGQPLVSVLDLETVRSLPDVTAAQENTRIARYVHARTRKAQWGREPPE